MNQSTNHVVEVEVTRTVRAKRALVPCDTQDVNSYVLARPLEGRPEDFEMTCEACGETFESRLYVGEFVHNGVLMREVRS